MASLKFPSGGRVKIPQPEATEQGFNYFFFLSSAQAF